MEPKIQWDTGEDIDSVENAIRVPQPPAHPPVAIRFVPAAAQSRSVPASFQWQPQQKLEQDERFGGDYSSEGGMHTRKEIKREEGERGDRNWLDRRVGEK